MKDTKDKMIELLKNECGLKGQLINMMIELEGMNVILGESGFIPILEKFIDEIDSINNQVLALEEELTNPKTLADKKN